jgi:hypothetical protein
MAAEALSRHADVGSRGEEALNRRSGAFAARQDRRNVLWWTAFLT